MKTIKFKVELVQNTSQYCGEVFTTTVFKTKTWQEKRNFNLASYSVP